MTEVYWFIKRRDCKYAMVHTGSWWREGAWEPVEKMFNGKTRRQLRKNFVAIKATIVPIASKQEIC